MNLITPRRRILIRQAIREMAETVIMSALLYLVISTLLGRFEIQQVSMEPNFHQGQRVIVSQVGSLLSPWLTKTAYAADQEHMALFEPKRGQVVVFRSVKGEEPPLIKRVIGVPGDTIEIAHGGIWVNGKRLDEPYVHGLATSCSSYCGPIALDSNMYFVMGDNRPNSRDSRSFGPVPGGQIIGRVIMRYWPLSKFEIYP